MVKIFRIATVLWAVGAVLNILTDAPRWLSAVALTGTLACWGASLALVANQTIDKITKDESEDQE